MGLLRSGPARKYPLQTSGAISSRIAKSGNVPAELGSAEWTKALAEKSEAEPAHFDSGDDILIALSGALEKWHRKEHRGANRRRSCALAGRAELFYSRSV